MEEQLIHFIWHRQLFTSSPLLTTNGEVVEIFHTGFPNYNQGPDFLQSRIRIGDQMWAGHVEIHLQSSAWFIHQHHHDHHYNNVILHVVWLHDQQVVTQDGYQVPTLELKEIVDKSLLQRYRQLMNNQEWVPCASAIPGVEEIIRFGWLDRLMAERLEYKTTELRRILERCRMDWEQTFFVLLARQLGAPANAMPLEELAWRIPCGLLRKHHDRIDQIEAILFGAAGMLPRDHPETYVVHLKNEFDFLKKKYRLESMQGLQWKFMRMRPPHFPTLRIAQLAVMIKEQDHFMTLLEQELSSEQWIRIFRVKPPHPFWETHYHFSSATSNASRQLGLATAQTLIINVVTPLMFLYGKHQGQQKLKDRAIGLLQEMPAETNSIIRQWSDCGWRIDDAGQSQALIHLKKQYCDQRKCLHCAIGLQVLR